MHTKQETKCTPAPYSISGIPGDNHVMAFVPRLGRKVNVAIVPGFPGISPEEHQANLALFRSAPELLAALRLARNIINTEGASGTGPGDSKYHDARCIIESAILSATT